MIIKIQIPDYQLKGFLEKWRDMCVWLKDGKKLDKCHFIFMSGHNLWATGEKKGYRKTPWLSLEEAAVS